MLDELGDVFDADLGNLTEFVWREMRLEFWHVPDEEIDFLNLELIPNHLGTRQRKL